MNRLAKWWEWRKMKRLLKRHRCIIGGDVAEPNGINVITDSRFEELLKMLQPYYENALKCPKPKKAYKKQNKGRCLNLTKRQIAYQFMELSWIKRKEIFKVLNIDNTKKEDVDLLEEIFENNSLEIIDNLINKI